jgi:hypothetical protein
MNHTDTMSGLGRDLEDAFFLEEERKLMERLRALSKVKETKELLSKVSGIKDDRVLQKLVDLDVRPDLVASLAVIPLIEVAWADGGVDERERRAVLAAAESTGIRRGDIDYDLLDAWLTRRPDPRLLEAWKHYVEGLCAMLTPEERMALRGELLDHAYSVAEASGGFLGLGSKVSKDEAAVLRRLQEAFGERP